MQPPDDPRFLFEIDLDAPALVAAAVHEGHRVRDEVAPLLAVDEEHRRREEDPYTGPLTSVAPNRIIGHHSRFEFDLNRPPQRAIYLEPQDAWGITVWHEHPGDDVLEISRAGYRAFYEHCQQMFDALVARHGRFVVLDLHSYNHRRDAPTAAPADPSENPDVNLGTGSLDRQRWGPVADAFLEAMAAPEISCLGRRLDVRENVRFTGGYFSHWIHEHYPETGCALAIEFKKIFMDEWTGELDEVCHRQLHQALDHAARATLEAMNRLPGQPDHQETN